MIADYPTGDVMCEKIHGSYMDYVKACSLYGSRMEGQLYQDRAQVWSA